MMGSVIRPKALVFIGLYVVAFLAHGGESYSQMVDDGKDYSYSGSWLWLFYGILHAIPIILAAGAFRRYFVTVLAALAMAWVAVGIGSAPYAVIDLFFVVLGLAVSIWALREDRSSFTFPVVKQVEARPPPAATPVTSALENRYLVGGVIGGLLFLLIVVFSPPPSTRQAAVAPPPSEPAAIQARPQSAPAAHPKPARPAVIQRDVRHCLNLKSNAEIVRCTK